MSIIGLEEERRTRNCAQDTTCSDTLDILKDMYQGQAHIATCREPLYVHPCCPLPHPGHIEVSTFTKSEQQVHDKGQSIFPGVVGHSSVGGCNMDPPQKLHYFSSPHCRCGKWYYGHDSVYIRVLVDNAVSSEVM